VTTLLGPVQQPGGTLYSTTLLGPGVARPGRLGGAGPGLGRAGSVRHALRPRGDESVTGSVFCDGERACNGRACGRAGDEAGPPKPGPPGQLMVRPPHECSQMARPVPAALDARPGPARLAVGGPCHIFEAWPGPAVWCPPPSAARRSALSARTAQVSCPLLVLAAGTRRQAAAGSWSCVAARLSGRSGCRAQPFAGPSRLPGRGRGFQAGRVTGCVGARPPAQPHCTCSGLVDAEETGHPCGCECGPGAGPGVVREPRPAQPG
jgi:hypothetical protein